MLRTSNSSLYGFPMPNSSQTRTSIKTPNSPLVPSLLSNTVTDSDNASDSSSDNNPPNHIFTPTETDSTRFSADSSRTTSAESPHKIDVQTPQPHLPLRKQAAITLRTNVSPRTSASPRTSKDDATPQTSLASLALRLRPESRWSQGSASSDIDLDEPDPSKAHSNIPTPIIPERPYTTVDLQDPGFLAATTASPILRPTTSAHDYADTDLFHKDTLTTTPPHPSSDGTKSPESDRLPTKRRPTIGQDSAISRTAESIRSAATNASSVPDFSSNGRASTWTERSSMSEAPMPASSVPGTDDDELTVEDCIAMYAQGFYDDPPAGEISVIPEEQPLKIPEEEAQEDEDTVKHPSTISHVSSGDSRSIQSETPLDTPVDSPMQENGENIPPLPPLPSIYSDNQSTRSVPSIQLPLGQHKPARDRYGFKKETQHIKIDDYTTWEPKYKKHMESRRMKWIHLMNESGCPSVNPKKFPLRSDKVKRYVRKGIPPKWRGAAWFFYADGAAYLEANPGLYRRLVSEAADGGVAENDRELIERDLHRTLPENKHFKPDELTAIPDSTADSLQSDYIDSLKENDMIKSLRNILQAFAVHHPRIGYCQSLNFLAGHLVLFMRSAFPNQDYEERAFALLCILTEEYLPGTHGIVLEGANVDIGVLMMLIQESMPTLWAKLDDKSEVGGAGSPAISRQGTAGLPSVSLATTAWFMSCFVSTLPIETTCRVWDCLWYEGSKTIFRVALAIFKLGEREIRRSKDTMEMFQIVQNLPRSLLDANLLMDIATKKRKLPGSDSISSRIGPGVGGFGGLSQKTVERLREERRALCQRERERTDGISPPPIPEDSTPTVARSLSRSPSRGRLKRFKSIRKLTEKTTTA